jgi:predicted MPP superfamily phosphohydrolase
MNRSNSRGYGSRRKKRTVALAVFFLVVGGLTVWSFLIEPNRLVVHTEVIRLQRWPAQLNGLKIAAIGDIHAGSPFINEEKLTRVVALTNEQHPDLIVLLGDYMVRDRFYRAPIEPEVTAKILAGLHAPLGVYAVLGNHDWWFDGERVTRAFQSAGITVLENQVKEVKKDEQSLWLVGLSDLWTRPQAILQTFGQLPEGAVSIALTHNPDSFVQVPATAQLTLAAHTHGGQVNLPLVGRLVVPSDYGQSFAAGHVEEYGKHLFVTTGIGTSILPVRFRVPPEVAVVTLMSSTRQTHIGHSQPNRKHSSNPVDRICCC